MTIIASFKLDNYYFLLGDLLISRLKEANHIVNHAVHLPSVGDVNQELFKGSTLFPYGTSRKACHFSNLAVAWAGKYNESRTILKNIYDETRDNGPISFDRLNEIFSTLEPKCKTALEKGEVSILGYIIDPHDKSKFGFGTNFSWLHTALFEDFRISGSGAKTVQNYFDHRSPFELNAGGDMSFEKAVCTALDFTGMLLQLEIGTSATIADHFGGGFELIGLKENRFVMCDDLISIFWFGQFSEGNITITPLLKFFKQSYFGDILTIRTLELKSPDQDEPQFFTGREDEVHYFAPVYREPSPEEISSWPKPDLTAFMLCSYILIESQGEIEVLTKFDWSKKRELPIRFTSDGSKMAFEIHRSYFEDIFNAIESRYMSS
jgi:hypothetical protein